MVDIIEDPIKKDARINWTAVCLTAIWGWENVAAIRSGRNITPHYVSEIVDAYIDIKKLLRKEEEKQK